MGSGLADYSYTPDSADPFVRAMALVHQRNRMCLIRVCMLIWACTIGWTRSVEAVAQVPWLEPRFDASSQGGLFPPPQFTGYSMPVVYGSVMFLECRRHTGSALS